MCAGIYSDTCMCICRDTCTCSCKGMCASLYGGMCTGICRDIDMHTYLLIDLVLPVFTELLRQCLDGCSSSFKRLRATKALETHVDTYAHLSTFSVTCHVLVSLTNETHASTHLLELPVLGSEHPDQCSLTSALLSLASHGHTHVASQLNTTENNSGDVSGHNLGEWTSVLLRS